MRKTAFGVLVAIVCLSMTGCGGCGSVSVSEAQMRKASQRQRAPEPPDPPAAKANDAKTDNAKAPEQGAPAAPPALAASTVATALPASPGSPGDAPMGISFSNEKPSQPLTEVERRARSIANLEKIGRALMAYTKKNRKLPPLASSMDSDALLSWRVLILPELGYPELRRRFKHEPWDSPHNKLLLDYIPPEYQSPERFDIKTNYLAVSGGGTAFPDLEGLAPSELKDGADNSLGVVEVDDKFAVEWTRPADHVPVLELPGDKLGGLRGEGTFGLMASGRVVLLPREMPPSRLAALFTMAGGEPVNSASLPAPTAEPPPPTLAAIADDPASANQPAPSDTVSGETGAAAAAAVAFPGSLGNALDAAKEAVPDEESLAKARELLKELYGKDFQKARTPDEQKELLKRLLDGVADVEQNPADFHELARIARDLAAALGDVPQALAACELLERRFQVDSLSMRLAVLEAVNKRASESGAVESALKEGRRLLRESFEADRYDVALPLCEVTLSLARIQGNKAEITRLAQNATTLETARSLYIAAERAFATLQASPADAAANEAVGKYVCLVKNRWDAGLPYLGRAADIRLRGIASLELSANRSLQETLSLANQYWELADRFKQPLRRGLHLRAVYCYGVVAPKLATSLEKLKAQRKIDEAAGIYGREEIDRVLAPLSPKDGSGVLSSN